LTTEIEKELEGNPNGQNTASRSARNSQTAHHKAIPTAEQIQLRAYEIYVERRGAPGNQMDDWLQAERELASAGRPKTRKATRPPKSEAA
jgi:hypothetical protein